MNKFKFDIQKNNLSWEKTHYKKCDSPKCNEKGEYRAPKSRVMLNKYFYFCLDHIKEYNKSWDFYKGMSVEQIENSMRSDTFGIDLHGLLKIVLKIYLMNLMNMLRIL